MKSQVLDLSHQFFFYKKLKFYPMYELNFYLFFNKKINTVNSLTMFNVIIH